MAAATKAAYGRGVKAIALDRFGGTDVLQLVDLPEPKLGPDWVVIRVRAAGVNPVDAKVRAGSLEPAFPTTFPLVPGWDVAGVVEQVGPAVPEYSVGDEVIGYVRKDVIGEGTYAELVAANVRHVAPKPASASFEEAAALPLAGLTAEQALDAAAVADGDTVLVHAAAGGVGTFAVQLATLRGARVLGTASERNADYLRGLGAEPVTYGEGLADRVRALAPGGVDAAVDLVGGESLDVSAELVADRGRIVSVVDAEAVLRLGGRYVFVRPDAAMLARLSDLVDDGRLRVEVSRTFPLEEAAQAQELIESGHVRGKVVLTVG
jgi:NADPH:quinone reductase-like Zn-dependent oxidoreductase